MKFEKNSNLFTNEDPGIQEKNIVNNTKISGEQENVENFIESIEELGPEKVMEIEEGFMQKFAEKTRGLAYVIPLLTALAASVPREVTADSAVHRYTREEYQQMRNEGVYSKDSYIQRKLERIYSQKQETQERNSGIIQRAEELAEKMGISFNPDTNEIHTEGKKQTPTTINGYQVPVELLNSSEREDIEHTRRLMSDTDNTHVEQEKATDSAKSKPETAKEKQGKSSVIEGGDYMEPSDF